MKLNLREFFNIFKKPSFFLLQNSPNYLINRDLAKLPRLPRRYIFTDEPRRYIFTDVPKQL